MILSPDLVKDLVPGPERGGGPGVLAGGDGDGLPLLAGHHVEVDLDEPGLAVRPAGPDHPGLVVRLTRTLEVGQTGADILVVHQEISRLTESRLHVSGTIRAKLRPGAAQEENVIFLQQQRSGTFRPGRQEETSVLQKLN